MKKKSDQAPDKAAAPLWRERFGALNLLGILLAFCFAFGGIFVVRNLLTEEKLFLLEGSGMIEIPVQDIETEVLNSDARETEKVQLTAEELLQAVKNLDREAEARSHEPLPGQLSMVQALERGREWMEDFFLPGLGVENPSREYKTSCHLWSLQEEEGSDGEDADSLLLSYWTVTLRNQDMAASLTLNAVTGQVLDVSASFYFPIEHSESGSLISLLEDYTDSFGVGVRYSSLLVDTDKEVIYVGDNWGMYQFLQDGELFAVLQTKNVGVNSVKDNIFIYKNIFCVHLYLGTQIYEDYEE